MNWAIWLGLFLLAVFIFAGIMENDSKSKRSGDLEKARKEARKLDRIINRGSDHSDGARQNRSGREAALSVSIVGSDSIPVRFDTADVLSAELETNTTSRSKTNAGSLATRAVVGGAALGPLGALAGAVTSSKTSSELVSAIKVRVVTRHGVRHVTFYDGEPKPAGHLSSEFDAAHHAIGRLMR